MRRVLVGCVVLLAGCFNTPAEVRLQIACTTVCTCVDPNDTKCVEQCIENAAPTLVQDECFECIQLHANACATLISDCDNVCSMPEDDPPPPPADGGMP